LPQIKVLIEGDGGRGKDCSSAIAGIDPETDLRVTRLTKLVWEINKVHGSTCGCENYIRMYTRTLYLPQDVVLFHHLGCFFSCELHVLLCQLETLFWVIFI